MTTNFALYDFARNIAGDKAKVAMLLPPGSESHSYEPTPQDMKLIRNARLFLYVGGESDEWVGKTLKAVGGKISTVKAMQAVSLLKEEVKEGMSVKSHDDDEYDEHVWTSPVNAMKIVDSIASSLTKVDNANAAAYGKNAAAYKEKLQKLDSRFAATVKQGKRKVIVFGDRFPLKYFVDRYKLDYYAAFPGCAKDTEPSAATLAFLIKKVRQEKIPVIFHTEMANEKVADVLTEATGSKKRCFHSCHNVSREEFIKGVTYLELMEKNVVVLKEALD